MLTLSFQDIKLLVENFSQALLVLENFLLAHVQSLAAVAVESESKITRQSNQSTESSSAYHQVSISSDASASVAAIEPAVLSAQIPISFENDDSSKPIENAEALRISSFDKSFLEQKETATLPDAPTPAPTPTGLITGYLFIFAIRLFQLAQREPFAARPRLELIYF